ncbi:MAG TPA: DUF4388 domain-containing protein [Kofleriaceae bacterium]|jgi:hypothetical protein|nr:DUF4388 domain-containing protein [Kofleriaceae bacterium]
MEGDLNLLSVPDLLQMICLGRFSRNIHLFDGPILIGVIEVRDGRIERCIGLGSRGETAFYKLVRLRRGRYTVREATDLGTPDAALSTSSWQMLLLEAARRYDEAQHQARSGPAVAMTFDVPTRQTSGSIPTSLPAALSDFDQFV